MRRWRRGGSSGPRARAWPAPPTPEFSFLPADHVPDASNRTGNVGLRIPRDARAAFRERRLSFVLVIITRSTSFKRNPRRLCCSAALRWHLLMTA